MTGACDIGGSVVVSGENGMRGRENYIGGGGGAGGGAVKITCDSMFVGPAGRIMADGGEGGWANQANSVYGQGGRGVAGGSDGGAGNSYPLNGMKSGQDGSGPGGGKGGPYAQDMMPPGASGGVCCHSLTIARPELSLARRGLA